MMDMQLAKDVSNRQDNRKSCNLRAKTLSRVKKRFSLHFLKMDSQSGVEENSFALSLQEHHHSRSNSTFRFLSLC